MYCLRAVIATDQVLSDLAGDIEDAHDAHIVFLGQHLSLLPTTDALFDAVTVAGHLCRTGSGTCLQRWTACWLRARRTAQ
jgi:hypothetical protein